ncbi:MAG: hypothetical protein U0797_01980 [Gemmataceae bacterium]
MRLKHRPILLPLLVVLALPAVGCGPGKSTVSGKVTLDGKDLYAGTIVFAPAHGVAVSGDIKEGQYKVAGVPNGEAKVTVDTRALASTVEQAKRSSGGAGNASLSGKGPPPGAKMSAEAAEALQKQQQAMAEASKAAKDLATHFRPVPDKYGSANTSGLTHMVGGGSGTFNIELTSK